MAIYNKYKQMKVSEDFDKSKDMDESLPLKPASKKTRGSSKGKSKRKSSNGRSKS